MKVPLTYSFRNLMTRRLTTGLTTSGMMLVVFVFATTLMLTEGLRKTLVNTGAYDNVLILRRASQSEIQSGIDRYQASVIQTQPEIAIGENGRRLIAKELAVIINLPKKRTEKPSNVTLRGISEQSIPLRPQVDLVEGRLPKMGSSEIITGESIARRFKGCDIGEKLRFAMRDWTIVGIFSAGNTAFDSEIWGDVDQFMQAFRRPVYSSITLKLRDPLEFDSLKERVENDPRLTLSARREVEHYADQSRVMSAFLSVLGMSLTIMFSIGATIGAMITMYAAVANRTSEIGTLRALGFQRRSILIAFLIESMLMSSLGGFFGLIFSSFMQFFTISTVNWQTFSELAFSFTLTGEIIYKSVIFSLIMGFMGGTLPAYRAARMNIVDALGTR
jgi:putative ABC transport system permease protein